MLVALRPLAVGWAVLSCCDRWYRDVRAAAKIAMVSAARIALSGHLMTYIIRSGFPR